jgi:signal transduction histidine kinase
VLATEERKHEMDFSVAHTRLKAGFYVRRGQRPIRRAEDLRGKRIAVLSMATSHSLAKIHQGWGGEIVVFQTQAEAIESVRTGQCDTVISRMMLAHEPLAGLRFSFADDVEYRFRFAVRKGNSATLAVLNDGIARLLRNGRLEEIAYTWTGAIQPRPMHWRDYRHLALPLGAVFLGGAVLIIRQYNQRAVLAERMRIARDLHDELGNRLSEMQLLAERAIMDRAVATAEFIPRIREQMVETSESLNQLIWMLGPKSSTWRETAQAIRSISQRYLESAGVENAVTVSVAPAVESRPIPQAVRRALIMATRELIKNAVNHARPREVNVDLTIESHLATLRVTDSGPGVDPALALGKGRGLEQLQARVRRLRGNLEITGAPGAFVVQIQLPHHS